MKNKIIVLEQKLVKSRAWLSLGGVAPQVYLIFRTKLKIGKALGGKPGNRGNRTILNNGEIEFTFNEAEDKYKLTRPRFKRSLADLHDKGFIDVEVSGQGIKKVKSLYAISDRWCDYGTDKFIVKQWPKSQKYSRGFKPGNKLGRNSKKITSDKNVTLNGVSVDKNVPLSKTSVDKTVPLKSGKKHDKPILKKDLKKKCRNFAKSI